MKVWILKSGKNVDVYDSYEKIIEHLDTTFKGFKKSFLKTVNETSVRIDLSDYCAQFMSIYEREIQ